MKSIGLSTFKITMTLPNGDPVNLNTIFGRPFSDLFNNYLTNIDNTFEDDTDRQKILSASTFTRNDILEEMTDEVLYTRFTGTFESGEYGISSDIVDVESGTVVYHREPTEADVLPFHFTLAIPYEETNTFIIIFQNISSNGVKSVFYSSFKSYIRSIYNGPLKIDIGSLMPREYLNRILDQGTFNKVRLISHHFPQDISERFGLNRGANVVNEGYIETQFIKGRSFAGTVGNIARSIINVFTTNGNITEIQELNGYDYDNIKIEVSIGGRSKTLNFNRMSNLNLTEDITDYLTDTDSGLPIPQEVYSALEEKLAEYLDALGIMG